MSSFSKSELSSFIVGVVVGGLMTYNFLLPQYHTNDDSHHEPDKYHIHSDFLIQIRDTTLELGTSELMSTASHTLNDHAHLHADEGEVVHMHEDKTSFVEFLDSLGFSIANECISTKNEEEFCKNETETISLYVNEKLWTDSLEAYVPQDLDRILLYYGNPDINPVDKYLKAIPNDACLYSGSCPERGIAPPEECGLTCEL